MDSNNIECESSIVKVDVYARGAVVTRRVELPLSVQPEACTLVISGVSKQLEVGSLRTIVDGERLISSLRTHVLQPEVVQPDPIDAVEMQKLHAERHRNAKKIERVQRQVDLFEGMDLNQDLLARGKNMPAPNVAERYATALKVSDTIDSRLRALYTEMRARKSKERDIKKRINQAGDNQNIQIQQGPIHQILIGLASGSEHLRALEISYSVSSARWWPAYSVRLTDGGQSAEFALEAFVAQHSGEDWNNIAISLCTADMVQDIRLPVMDSLRYGRKQAVPRSGYREPPEGLSSLFNNFDSYMDTIANHAKDQFMSSPKAGAITTRAEPAPVAAAYEPEIAEDYDDEDDDLEMADIEEGYLDDAVMLSSAAQAEMEMPPPAPAAKQAAPERSKKRSKPIPSRRGSKAGKAEMQEDKVMSNAYGAGGAAPGGSLEAPEEPENSTSEEWLDFDQLLLGGSGDGSYRGRLSHAPVSSVGGGSLTTPDNTSDPLYSRGMFDHRFAAKGKADIPTNGHAHRIQLLTKDAASEMQFRCAPHVDDRVFREVEMTNPFEAPLLPGPIDVFVDGTLAMTSTIDAVDRGGKVNFGIGEEQRLRIARNARMDEESKGLLGGKSEIDHVVNIDIASSLGVDVVVDVVGRIPVTDDSKIDVELMKSKPGPREYHQQDRDSFVKGGLLWKLPVPAGGKSGIEYEYRIVLPADYELEGGNRRE